MKTILTLIMLALMTAHVHGQSTSDQESVLKQSIDLTELGDLFPKDENGNYLPVRILQHAVSFDEGITIQKFGLPVQFIAKNQIGQMRLSAFFLFSAFSISGDQAQVAFSFDYDRDTESPKRVIANLKLSKTGDVWIIIESKLEWR